MKFVRLLFSLLLGGCGGFESPSLQPLLERQPQVITIQPDVEQQGYVGKTIELTLSQNVAPETVTPATMPVVILEDPEIAPADLQEQILQEKVTLIAGNYEVITETAQVRFAATQDFPAGKWIGVLVTPGVLSVERIPLNQTPGSGPTPFYSRFFVAATNGTPSQNLENRLEEGGAPTAQPAVAQQPRPERLIIHELFYDAVGKDTEGTLFIELDGDPGKSIAGYSVLIVRASDGAILDSLKIPDHALTGEQGFFVIADAPTGVSGTTNVIGADLVQNFDPPNTAGAVQLIDPDGNLVDVLGYGAPVMLRGENGLFCYETTPAPTVSSGQSLSRTNGIDTDDNAKDWIANEKPTPGEL